MASGALATSPPDIVAARSLGRAPRRSRSLPRGLAASAMTQGNPSAPSHARGQSMGSIQHVSVSKVRITTCCDTDFFFTWFCRKLRCACGAWLHRLSLAVAASWRHAECKLRCAITTPRHHALACCDNAHLSLGSQMRSWGRTLRLHRLERRICIRELQVSWQNAPLGRGWGETVLARQD